MKKIIITVWFVLAVVLVQAQDRESVAYKIGYGVGHALASTWPYIQILAIGYLVYRYMAKSSQIIHRK
jgi:hypothetical protein